MYRIPQHVLDNLRCSLCDGYLSSKPLVVKSESQQVCGKCFKLLPTEEKEKCVRQIGLEALAEIFVFPCRYNIYGCGYTYSWCDEKDHEVDCPYRFETLSKSSDHYEHLYNNIYSNNLTDSMKCESNDVTALFKYELDRSSSKYLSYSLNIKGTKDKVLVLRSEQNPSQSPTVELCFRGKIALNPVQNINSELTIKPTQYENVYESLSGLNQDLYCLNCRNTVTDDRYSCLFGHISCQNCRGLMCPICVKVMEKESKGFCRNYHKGCQQAWSQDELNRHQDDCQYNDVRCPLEPCNFISTLSSIYVHLKQDHADKIYIQSDVSRTMHNKDDVFVVLCHENIFKCVYYYYKSAIDFYVSYIGSSRDAQKYSYEVSIIVDGTILKKKAKCADWNNVMLEKGISFNKKELMSTNEKKLNFDINLKIIVNR